MKADLPTVTAVPDRQLSPNGAAILAKWGRLVVFFAAVAAPAGIIVHLIASYAVDVPFWDQWVTARYFSASHYGHQSILELASQQNESRLLFPNLIFLALSALGHWNVVREMYFEVALIVLVCAVLFQLLRRTGFSLPVQAGLLFAIAWMLFSLTQHENWFFGIQICYCMVPAALCVALLANVSNRPLVWKTAVSLLLAFVAAFSFSGGVIVALLAFPGYLPANWSAAGGWRPQRREMLWHAVYIVLAAGMLIGYFGTYRTPPEPSAPLDFIPHLKSSAGYFLAWLGSPIFPHEPISHAVTAGACAFVLLGGLLAACWRALLDRLEQQRLYPWVMLAAYAVGTGMMTVLGRSGYGLSQALSSRYISFSSYAYVVILVLGAYLWRFHRRRLAAWARFTLLGAGLLVLVVGATFFAEAQLETAPWIVDSSHHRNFARQGLVFLPLLGVSQNLYALCGETALVEAHAMDLLRRHVLDLPVASPALRDAVQHPTETGDSAYGELDQPDMDANGRVSIRGWAVDPILKRPAGDVLVTCTDSSGTVHLLVVLVTDIYRPDGAPAPGDYQQLPCAFMGLIDFDRLAPGDYRVAAWTVNVPANTVSQIGLTYLFHWERPGTLSRPLESVAFPALFPQQDGSRGALESVAVEAGNVLRAQGWAMDINSNLPPKAVLLTCTDAAGVTRILGHAGPGGQRADVAKQFRNDSLMYCGFNVRGDLGQLPPGNYRAAAWGIGFDADEEPVQLGGTFPVQIPPRP